MRRWFANLFYRIAGYFASPEPSRSSGREADRVGKRPAGAPKGAIERLPGAGVANDNEPDYVYDITPRDDEG